MWEKESVRKELESNPHFHLLTEEFVGKFACIYKIDGISVLIFHLSGGKYEAYFGDIYNATDVNISNAQRFVTLAINILNETTN